MKILRILVVSTLAICQPSLAETATIRLICTYDYTLDPDGKRSETSGEDLVTVSYSESCKAAIRKQGLGAVFIGTITHEEIQGEASWQLRDITVKQAITINRFTGAFQLTFEIPPNGGLIHYGTCRPAERHLF